MPPSCCRRSHGCPSGTALELQCVVRWASRADARTRIPSPHAAEVCDLCALCTGTCVPPNRLVAIIVQTYNRVLCVVRAIKDHAVGSNLWCRSRGCSGLLVVSAVDGIPRGSSLLLRPSPDLSSLLLPPSCHSSFVPGPWSLLPRLSSDPVWTGPSVTVSGLKA